jgi:hypothetical protein
MANLKGCRISTSDYSYTQIYAIFAPLVIFVPKDTAQGGQFRVAICLLGAGIMKITSVQVRKSKRNINITALLLRCISGDHTHCSFYRILTTTAKYLFISLQQTVAPWLEHGGNTKISGSAGCTIPGHESLETHRLILFSQAVYGSILDMLQEGM